MEKSGKKIFIYNCYIHGIASRHVSMENHRRK